MSTEILDLHEKNKNYIDEINRLSASELMLNKNLLNLESKLSELKESLSKSNESSDLLSYLFIFCYLFTCLLV